MLHLDGFLFLALPTQPHWNAFTEQLVAPSPTASRSPLSHFFSLKCLYLPYKSSGLISPYHLINALLVSSISFPISGLVRQDSPIELLRPLTRLCFLLLILRRFSLHALPLLLGTYFHSLWSPPLPPHAPALILFFLAKVRLSLTLTLSHLTIFVI